MLSVPKCSVDGCEHHRFKGGLCLKHSKEKQQNPMPSAAAAGVVIPANVGKRKKSQPEVISNLDFTMVCCRASSLHSDHSSE